MAKVSCHTVTALEKGGIRCEGHPQTPGIGATPLCTPLFAKNQFYSSSENSDLFLNSVNWLAEDFDLISIRPKLFPFRELVVTTREINFIKWSSWLLPPGLMLILGSVIWWRRR